MAIIEARFDQSRRGFLTLAFARRRRDGQPLRRPRRPDNPSSPQPPDWNWFDKKVNRRTVIGIGSLLAGLGVGAFVADRLGLLKFFPPSPEQPESERRKKGIKLEDLQFDTQTGVRFEKDKFYTVGKMSIQQQTTNYDLIFNLQQLAYIADKCGVNKVPEVFQIIISERYARYNQQGQLEEKEAEVTSDGSKITTFIGLDTLFKKITKLLDQDFEVSPEKRAQAEDNFKVLVLNWTIMKMLCAATILGDLDRKEASRQEAEQATEKATQIADTFREEMLNGQTAPAIIVSRLPAKFF